MKQLRNLLSLLVCLAATAVPAFAQGTWDNGKAAMPLARHGAAAAVINELMYVHGGRTSNTALSNALHIYDGMTNTWSTCPVTAVARNAAVGAVLNGKF